MQAERFFSLRFFRPSGYPFWGTAAAGSVLVILLAGVFLTETPLCNDVSGADARPLGLIFRRGDAPARQVLAPKTPVRNYAPAEASEDRNRPAEPQAAETVIPAAKPEPSENFAAKAKPVAENAVRADGVNAVLEGFCAVTLVEEKAWFPGDPQFGVSHRGQIYFFASEEKAERFFANPDYYAVAAGGDDVVRLMDFQEHRAGSRTYGARYEDVNFMFSSAETREIFRQNPEKYFIPLRLEMLRTETLHTANKTKEGQTR